MTHGVWLVGGSNSGGVEEEEEKRKIFWMQNSHLSFSAVRSSFERLAFTLQIAVHHGHQVPEHSEDEPGPCKGGREEEELVAPLHIQESRPQVAEVEGPPPAHVLDQNIAPAVFGEDSAPPSQGAGASGTHSRTSIALLGA